MNEEYLTLVKDALNAVRNKLHFFVFAQKSLKKTKFNRENKLTSVAGGIH